MKVSLMIFCISLMPFLVYSQSGELSVQDALKIAMQNNPQLNQFSEELHILKQVPGTVLVPDKPEIFYTREGLDGRSFMEQKWGISQSFRFPVAAFNRYRQAKMILSAAEMRYESEIMRLNTAVKSAYTELAYAIKFAEMTESEVYLAGNLRDIAEARLEVGESTEIDLIQAEIRLFQVRNDLKNAEELKNRARYALFRIIGLEASDQMYGFTYPDTLAFADINLDQNELLGRVETSPEIKAAQHDVDAARQGIRVSKSSYLPDLRMDYYRQDFSDGYEFTGFEIGVKIPLWFGFNERNQVKQAHAGFRRTEWLKTDTILRKKEEAENAWHSYESSRDVILAYRDFIRSRSEELLELTQEGYRMGELDLLRVLEAQRTYLEGQQKYYLALKNYYLQLIQLEQFLPHEIVFTE
jgi:outer membrane protein, heavy metal efflux system